MSDDEQAGSVCDIYDTRTASGQYGLGIFFVALGGRVKRG